jgi:TetR/AcrR family transcriptional regulator, ethionamide resistance regulator
MATRYQHCVECVNTLSKYSTPCKVAQVTTVSSSRASRGRRSARPSGDDRELAILTTAEQLLEQRPLADISVDDLAKGAGISRPTFYFYFSSKDAVMLTLFERVLVEADSALENMVANPPADLKTLWRIGINVFVETFGSHRAVSLAADSARTNTDLRALWSRFMQKWVGHIATVIEAERARGAAPVTLPADELSAALNLLNEKVMLSSFADDRPSVPKERLLETLVHIWVSSIYGEQV